MAIQIITAGISRSFPDGTAMLLGDGDGVVVIGADAGAAYNGTIGAAPAGFAAVELGQECLAVHVGLQPADRHRRTVGFARFRLGNAEPTQLVEIVRQRWTDDDAIVAARAVFEAAGFKTALCEDAPGRIVDRLIRPYFNAILKRLDQSLASAEDMDATLRLGLGYPEGPNALLARTGLDHHHGVAQSLYVALGDPDFAPPRAAQVAAARVTGR